MTDKCHDCPSVSQPTLLEYSLLRSTADILGPSQPQVEMEEDYGKTGELLPTSSISYWPCDLVTTAILCHDSCDKEASKLSRTSLTG